MANKNWLDVLLESADEVDEVIDNAINSNDAQEIEDVSQAGTEVLDNGVSDDPNKLVYDKEDLYSQDSEMGEENVAGTVERDIDSDTETDVASGNETKAAVESVIDDTLDQLVKEGYLTIDQKREMKGNGLMTSMLEGRAAQNLVKTKTKKAAKEEEKMPKGKKKAAVKMEAEITPDEARSIYTETVGEFITENSDEINDRYKAKMIEAKKFKVKKVEAEKLAKDKKSVKESAEVTSLINSILDI